MLKCEICGGEFMNSDLFTAHMQMHLGESTDRIIEAMRGFSSLFQAQPDMRFLESLADMVAERVARSLTSALASLVPVVLPQAVPKATYPFEVVQMALTVITSGKSVEEALQILDSLKERMG